MKILVPLNDIDNIEKFVDAGADEFYLGFYDENWSYEFGTYSDINRMSGFGHYANKYSFREAIEIVKRIKNMNKTVYITMNANYYSDVQLQFIENNYLPDIKDSGADGVIVSTAELTQKISEYGIGAVASTMCAIYNTDILEVYKNFGVNRVIVPRDLSLSEIEAICRNSFDVDIEVFFMRNGCVFSDSHCLGMHRPECGSTCSFIRHSQNSIYSIYQDFKEKHDIEVNDSLYNQMFHKNTCGMCALFRLKEAGVTALKIVGRADRPDQVCFDIEWTKKNIAIAEKCISESEYLNKMILPDDMKTRCSFGLSCYYPEVRFAEV